MWQTVIVLIVIAAVLIYVIRHYVRIVRGEAAMCGECSGCCASAPPNGSDCNGKLCKPIESKEAEPVRQR